MSHAKLSWFNPIHWLALGFGSVLLLKRRVPLEHLLVFRPFLLAPLNWWEYLLALVVMTLAGIWICQYTAKAMGSTTTLQLSGMK